MKNIFGVLYIVCAMGCITVADAATYTIDRRQYVTRDVSPYSAVVAFGDGQESESWCTGTLTADGVVITAEHCLENDKIDLLSPYSYANHAGFGRLLLKNSNHVAGKNSIFSDYAFFAAYDENDATRRPVSDIHVLTDGDYSGDAQVLHVGYGALKILSDEEIADIRNAYMEYLRDKNTDTTDVGGRNVNVNDMNFLEQIKNGKFPNISYDIFRDFRLKASECVIPLRGSDDIYGMIAITSGCQSYHGDSGGPVFVKYKDKWHLLAIHVGGAHFITDDAATYMRAGIQLPLDNVRDTYRAFVEKINNDI